MTTQIEVRGLKELQARMKQFPAQLDAAQEKTMEASLLTLWENVPPYPQQPTNTKYDRTGLTGKSLGSAQGGGKAGGEPSIYTVKKLGSGFEGRFGTDLSYAVYVIGELQARWNAHWWKLKSVAEKSSEKIVRLWQTLADKLAKFLDGRGL